MGWPDMTVAGCIASCVAGTISATGNAASAQALAPQRGEPLYVLSQAEFVEAVQDALRNFSRNALHNNPLLRSRLVVEQVAAGGSTEGIAACRLW